VLLNKEADKTLSHHPSTKGLNMTG